MMPDLRKSWSPRRRSSSLRIREQIDEFHRELEQGITEEEKEEFSRILDKIQQNLTKI